jgi:hypothetical protein
MADYAALIRATTPAVKMAGYAPIHRPPGGNLKLVTPFYRTIFCEQ